MATSSNSQRLALLLCLVMGGLGPGMADPETTCTRLASGRYAVALIGIAGNDKLRVYDSSWRGYTAPLANLDTANHVLDLFDLLEEHIKTGSYIGEYYASTNCRNVFIYCNKDWKGIPFLPMTLTIENSISSGQPLGGGLDGYSAHYEHKYPLTAEGEIVFSSWYDPPWYGLVEKDGKQCLLTATPNNLEEGFNLRFNLTIKHTKSCVSLIAPASRGFDVDGLMYAMLSSKNVAVLKRIGETITLVETKTFKAFFLCQKRVFNTHQNSTRPLANPLTGGVIAIVALIIVAPIAVMVIVFLLFNSRRQRNKAAKELTEKTKAASKFKVPKGGKKQSSKSAQSAQSSSTAQHSTQPKSSRNGPSSRTAPTA